MFGFMMVEVQGNHVMNNVTCLSIYVCTPYASHFNTSVTSSTYLTIVISNDHVHP
jgi:hypothetical protein